MLGLPGHVMHEARRCGYGRVDEAVGWVENDASHGVKGYEWSD